METWLTEIIKQSPGLAVCIILVLIFMRYISTKDTNTQEVFNRVENLHNKTLEKIDQNTLAFGKMAEVIRKCARDEKENPL